MVSTARNVVLRAQRQPAEAALQAGAEVPLAREEDDEGLLDLGESRVRQPLPGLAPGEQDGVLVEWAVADGLPRQRVERIVLEDRDQPAGPRHPLHLRHEPGALRGWHVMEDADREAQVERRLLVGQRLAGAIGGIARPGIPARGPLGHAAAQVDPAQRAEAPLEEGVGLARTAADVERL